PMSIDIIPIAIRNVGTGSLPSRHQPRVPIGVDEVIRVQVCKPVSIKPPQPLVNGPIHVTWSNIKGLDPPSGAKLECPVCRTTIYHHDSDTAPSLLPQRQQSRGQGLSAIPGWDSNANFPGRHVSLRSVRRISLISRGPAPYLTYTQVPTEGLTHHPAGGPPSEQPFSAVRS